MAWMSDEAYEFMQDSRDKKITARSARSTRTHCGKSGPVKFPSDYLSKKELRKMNGECVKYASLKKPMTWVEFKQLPDDLKVTYIKRLRDQFNVPDKEIAAMFEVGYSGTLYRWFKTLGLSKGMGSGAKTQTWNKEGWLAWLHGVDPDAVEPSETPVPVEEVPETAETEAVVGTTTTHVDFYEAVRAEIATDEALEAIEEIAPLIPELKIGWHDDLEGDTCCREQATNEPKYVPYDEMMTKKLRKAPEKHDPDVQQYVDKFFHNKGETEDHICTTHYMPVIPKNGTMTFANNNADDALATIKALLSNSKVVLSVSWECV